jgi:tetratricopeptide (TPR) repeat protein
MSNEGAKGKGSGRILYKIFLLILILSLAIALGMFISKRMTGAPTVTTTSGDIASLAAFVSVSPDVLDYSSFISGIAENNKRTGHNWNFQYAIWLIEGLRAEGISRSDTSADGTPVQFPAETLSRGTGDSRDIALLYAAALEGAGVPAALIKTENDFLTAFSLGVNARAAETLFHGTDRILIVNDEVWLPLSMNAFNDGFTAAWTQAHALLGESFNAGKNLDFVVVATAWATYPPAAPPELEGRSFRTDLEMTANRANAAMTRYIEQELHQILRLVQAQINTNPTAALHNREGILQARIGRIPEAKAAYERAAGMGFIHAMTNRGNLALIERDFAGAEQWFIQALSKDSKNRAALRGLEKLISNEQ